ncbi:LuxR C-terminal-related transcriptional regulator [Pseudofrankia sp. BMG5.37]|uniref:LuxR C-terminal-related transcriptional regulator n=1 Tax=Pseudofrankia sp. BMG5.37 TaxID=3050035 RepID=UPI002893F3D8|nr:LuxR C-terminal-related transcriptional regulator [Pseudofrankia sp. BMG5.37]MDT3446832.1 LuxR C-terminal-related transcriptional regulator [Pseudofrankia sp. BMG5.37]
MLAADSRSTREALRAGLRQAQRLAGVPVVFAGTVSDDRLVLTDFLGTRTTSMRNLHVSIGAGLGGRVVAQGRPVAVEDYLSARTITHDYDRPVLAEGISSVLAVPVRVRGRCKAVLYGAVRERMPLGNRVREALLSAGSRLSMTLSVQDQVGIRLAMAEFRPGLQDLADLEEVRAVHAELRSIAPAVADPELRRRIDAATERLARFGAPKTEVSAIRLSPRETDVLAQVALGCTNAEVAERLSLTPETVKAYLYTIMRKLDARTRHEAVVRARQLWLLP